MEHFLLESAKNKPVVIFIDELDRCKPTFALAFLERLKHYFDIPNLVFVLLLNQESLCATIKKTYGQEVDADEYLQKFIGIQLQLPKNLRRTDELIKTMIGDYFDNKQTQIKETLQEMLIDLLSTSSMEVTFRALHKIMQNIWLVDLEQSQKKWGFVSEVILSFLVIVKITSPQMYQKIKVSDFSSEDYQVFIALFKKTAYFEYIRLMITGSTEQDKRDHFRNANHRYRNWDSYRNQYFKMIDTLEA